MDVWRLFFSTSLECEAGLGKPAVYIHLHRGRTYKTALVPLPRLVGCEGACVVCAEVCDKDHNLLYAKYSGFFCDCGARGNTYCKVCCVIFSRKYSRSIIDNAPETWQEHFSIR